MNTKTKKIALTGLLSALAYVSLWFIRIPIIPSASFLRFDIKDIFIAMIGIIAGPFYAFSGVICVSFLQSISLSEYGIIGFTMNVLSSAAFSLPIAFAYKFKKNKVGMILGIITGCILMITVMLLWNYVVTPLYMGVSRETVKQMLIPVFLPFNAIKSAINALILILVFNIVKKLNVIDIINK